MQWGIVVETLVDANKMEEVSMGIGDSISNILTLPEQCVETVGFS